MLTKKVRTYIHISIGVCSWLKSTSGSKIVVWAHNNKRCALKGSFLFLFAAVHKFRRRPRYLEFFLHLCSKALSDGQYADILEWSKEALAWLKRRNELLMQPKVLPLAKREPAVLAGDPARYSMVLQKYTVKPKVRTYKSTIQYLRMYICICMKNLFPTCYAYSVKKAIGKPRESFE